MLAVHDIGEIDCGDTFHYAKNYLPSQEIEQAAATRILALLPQDQRERFRALWNEFESDETIEARFARAIDRIWPVIQNMQNGGGSWLEFGITHDEAVEKNRHVADGSRTLWDYLQEVLKECDERGYFARQ